jgi:hypothetical protein
MESQGKRKGGLSTYLQVVRREYENAVEPLPESKVPVRKGLFTEERPGQHLVVVLIRISRKIVVPGRRELCESQKISIFLNWFSPKCLAGQVIEVVRGERAAAGGRPLHVERLSSLCPADLVRYDKRAAAPLGKRIVPCHSSQCLGLLVAVDDHDHWE